MVDDYNSEAAEVFDGRPMSAFRFYKIRSQVHKIQEADYEGL